MLITIGIGLLYCYLMIGVVIAVGEMSENTNKVGRGHMVPLTLCSAILSTILICITWPLLVYRIFRKESK